MSRSQRRFPAAGPTPVGQRLRAATIHGRRHDGPSADEWADCGDTIVLMSTPDIQPGTTVIVYGRKGGLAAGPFTLVSQNAAVTLVQPAGHGPEDIMTFPTAAITLRPF